MSPSFFHTSILEGCLLRCPTSKAAIRCFARRRSRRSFDDTHSSSRLFTIEVLSSGILSPFIQPPCPKLSHLKILFFRSAALFLVQSFFHRLSCLPFKGFLRSLSNGPTFTSYIVFCSFSAWNFVILWTFHTNAVVALTNNNATSCAQTRVSHREVVI